MFRKRNADKKNRVASAVFQATYLSAHSKFRAVKCKISCSRYTNHTRLFKTVQEKGTGKKTHKHCPKSDHVLFVKGVID